MKRLIPANGTLANAAILALCALWLSGSGPAFAQTDPGSPMHAYASRYGDGWNCRPGYDRKAQSSGRGWACNRGLRVAGATCARIKIPSNGFLGKYGDDWRCERGFTKRGENCALLAIPKSAYLDPSGSGWECERGFTREKAACTALTVPANAYILSSGHEWSCADGFRRNTETCIPQ